MEKQSMNALEASIEILKIVTDGQSLKEVDIDSRTDKVLENFQKIYQMIDLIVNQGKKDDSWGDTLEGIDFTVKGSRDVTIFDPTLKGIDEPKIVDPTLKGVEVFDPTLKGGYK